MTSVVISGVGQVSVSGQGVPALKRAWLEKIHPKPEIEMVPTARGPVGVSVFRVPELNVPKMLPPAVERRMSRFAKMCFVSAAEAIEDAGVLQVPSPERTGMVVGSAFSNLDLANVYQRRIIQDGPAGASPSMFAASIHNSIAAQLTLAFGIRGPNSTVATMEQTAISSLRLAYDWIQAGTVDRVVVLLGDEVSEYHRYYFAHMEGVWVAGEGMLAFVLEREDLAKKKYARVGAPSLTSELSAPTVFRAGANENSHFELYGLMVMAAAFELVFSILEIERNGGAVACVQSCRQLPPQSVVLSGI